MAIADDSLRERAAAAILSNNQKEASSAYSDAFKKRLLGSMDLPGVNTHGISRVLAGRKNLSLEKRVSFEESLVLTIHPLCESQMLNAWSAVAEGMRVGASVTWGTISAGWSWNELSTTEKVHKVLNLSHCFPPPPPDERAYTVPPELNERSSVLGRALHALPESAESLQRELGATAMHCVSGRISFSLLRVKYVVHCMRTCAMLRNNVAGVSNGGDCQCADVADLRQSTAVDLARCSQKCTEEMEMMQQCGGSNFTSAYILKLS
jgi:hypothetical protein